MRDVNEGPNSNRSQYYGDRASGSHPNSHDQQTIQPNWYLRFDRERIRQLIFVQNTTFRSQVHELQRLYNRQKELMEELGKKEPYGYLQADTSHSNSHAPQTPCDGTNKMSHIPHLPATSTSHNKEPVTMNDEKVVTINFLKESGMHSGPVSIAERNATENIDRVDSKHKRRSKRMFDLLLPADAYINCEDSEDSEKSEKEIVAESSSVNMFPPNSTPQAADHENDVNLALGTSEGLCYREDSWKSDPCTQNGVRGLADLNEPFEENFSERAVGSVSYNFLNQRTSLEENQDKKEIIRERQFFNNEAGRSSKEIIQEQQFFNNEGDKKEIIQERQFFNNEADKKEIIQDQQFFNNEAGKSFKEIIQEQQFFNNEAGRNITNMAIFSTASSKKNFSISSSEAPQPKFKKPVEILSPYQNKRGIPSRQNQGQGIEISGRGTPYSVPSSFSDFPGRDYTSPRNGSGHIPSAGQSLQCSAGAAARNRSRPSENLQRSGYLNLKPHLILGADPISSRRNSFNSGSSQMDYSRAPQLNLPQMIFGKQNLSGRLDSNTDRHGSASNPACLLPSHMELDFSRGYPHLRPSGISLQDTATHSQENRKRKNEPSSNGPSGKRLFGISISDGSKQSPAEPSGKRLFGISISDRSKHSPAAFSSASCQEQPVTGITKCSKKGEKKATSSKARKSNSRGLTNRINLNSDPSSWQMIDSEVPIGQQPDEASVKEAAENILWMFSSKEQNHLDDISSDTLTDDGPLGTLRWFAEVVSADAASPADGLDLFEQMTLNLEETKPEDYLCTPRKLEDSKEEDYSDKRGNAASLLFTKNRRGQGKKRRQRKDFQRDILPGLASLSRREVTEDIHTFSELMKASGQSWQSGVGKRNKGGNVTTNSRARGRQQPRNSAAPAAAEARVSTPPPPAVPVAAETTTGRCRRQRCPPATNVPASMA